MTRPMKALASSLIGIAIMSVSIAAPRSVPQKQLEPGATVVETAPATPYAHTTWVKLGELVPMETDGTDVYVRLIAIEGEVLLPTDSSE